MSAAIASASACWENGALGAIDPAGAKVGDIRLNAHPESFQIEANGNRIFVNLPGSHGIAAINRSSGSVEASWSIPGASANFPMALDEPEQRLFVVCRRPARMLALDTSSGKLVASLPAVADSDDVFYDRTRKRIYAIGGGGAVWVYQERDRDHYEELARIGTADGARTGFFSPELDRLFVAVPRRGQRMAEIRVYQPQ